MATLFFLLTFASIICLIVGLIKPSLFRLRSRKMVTKVFVMATVVFFILFAVSASETPSVENASTDLGTTTVTSDMNIGTTTLVTSTTSMANKVVSPVLNEPTSVAYGTRTKTSGCIADQALPDSACTPGAILSTSTAVICVSGYTKTVRNVPTSEKEAVFAEYGLDYDTHSNYEVDHLISLELGGSNDIANLFPESYLIENGARVKDKFENYLHSQICSGAMSVAEAQREIATDWLYYDQLRLQGKATTTVASTNASAVATTTQQQPTTTSSTDSLPVKKSSSGICHAPGTQYYDRTTNFTPYPSVDACIASGGRLPQ